MKMNNAGRLIMVLGLVALFIGAGVNALAGLSAFWHGIGWGMGIILLPMFVVDLIKNNDQYFG